MIPAPVGLNKEVKKGSGFGRIDVLNVLKANEQVRTSAASSK